MHMKCLAQCPAHDKCSINGTDDDDDEGGERGRTLTLGQTGNIVYHDVLANRRVGFRFWGFCFVLLPLSWCKGI